MRFKVLEETKGAFQTQVHAYSDLRKNWVKKGRIPESGELSFEVNPADDPNTLIYVVVDNINQTSSSF